MTYPFTFLGVFGNGDLDFIVSRQKPGFSLKKLAEDLGAERSRHAGRTISFAIPLPGGSSYCQLNVHLSRRDYYKWDFVLRGYGDLWYIIGIAVTRFGLAINDNGLHLRITAIEVTQEEDALLFLTSSPEEMMEFLSLDLEIFIQSLKFLDEVFRWATTCRLFRKRFFINDVVSEQEHRLRDERPMYARFVTEWLPQQSKLDSEPDEEHDKKLKDDLISEAVRTLGKHNEFMKMLEDYRQKLLKDMMWKRITTGMPLERKELGQVLVALHQRLYWGKHAPEFRTAADAFAAQVILEGEEGVDLILDWALEVWDEMMKSKRGAIAA